MVFSKKWLRNHPLFLLHFLIHIDVLMLCRKLESIPTSIPTSKWRILNFSFLAKFGPRPCTIVQGLLPGFGATLKNRKKSKCDRNQLKLSKQHKYMYMYQEKI